MSKQFYVYDALYAYCKRKIGQKSGGPWPFVVVDQIEIPWSLTVGRQIGLFSISIKSKAENWCQV
jgi:hypothetical protein